MDSTVHPDRFGITEETFVLKQKASTSIQRGTTGRSEMPVFPSSTHHKVKPLPGPPHRQLASHQHKCSLETAVLGPQTAQESFPGDCLNRIQRYIQDFPELSIHSISVILMFTAELIRMKQQERKRGFLPRQSPHCWCGKQRVV